ncbi:MAG: branched-chain amino acid ABC transporter permease [Actinobacteria bacterium]|nr:branched-chain amino acid ABC transporter permease [Actinomycetota bacterium]
MEAITSILLSMPLVGAYAIFGLGIVVIYQASRVLNLAHGGQAMFSAYAYFSMTNWGIPPIIAFVLGIAFGGALGYLVERFFVRPLRPVSQTAQTVGTVAALGLFIAVASRLWGTGGERIPGIFPAGAIDIGSTQISYAEIGVFVVMLGVSAALFVFLKFTDYGLAMRGTADNRTAAGLMGVDPDLATSAAWVLGGASAALAGILLGAATSIHPTTLSLQAIPAFVAALIGGMGSMPGVLVGSLIVGIAQGLAPVLPFTEDIEGGPQLILAAITFMVMGSRGETIVAAGDVRAGSL